MHNPVALQKALTGSWKDQIDALEDGSVFMYVWPPELKPPMRKSILTQSLQRMHAERDAAMGVHIVSEPIRSVGKPSEH